MKSPSTSAVPTFDLTCPHYFQGCSTILLFLLTIIFTVGAPLTPAPCLRGSLIPGEGVPNCKGILLRQGVLMWSSMQNFAVWFKGVVAHEEQTDPQPHPIPLYTHSYTRLCSPLLNRLKLLIEKRFCCVLGLELDKIGFSFEQSIEVFVITDHFTLKVNVSKPSKKIQLTKTPA